jgi:hypothetical protein
VGEDFIRVNTDADVRWISGGEEIANGPYVDLSEVGNQNHIRAEISNSSSVIYTQPWEIGHCDFDLDADCDVEDIDSLLAAGDLTSGVPVLPGINDDLELTDDDTLDQRDLDIWLAEAARRNDFDASFLRGDSNFDGVVDAADLNNLALNWLGAGSWTQRDFNGDGRTDGADLKQIGIHWNSSIAPHAAAVPEPTASLLIVITAALLIAPRRQFLRGKRPHDA